MKFIDKVKNFFGRDKQTRRAVAGTAAATGLLVGSFGLISVTGSQVVTPSSPSSTTPTTTTTTTTTTPTTTTSSPTGTPTQAVGAPYPDGSTTGVPTGTTLTAYTGPMTISTAGTTIDSKTVNGCLEITAPNVTITKTRINGCVVVQQSGSADLIDSEIHQGEQMGTGIEPYNWNLLRVEITGGNRSAYCKDTCSARDSYVHGQFDDFGCQTRVPSACAHESGIRQEANGTWIHNTIACDGAYVESNTTSDTAGCSAGLTGYPEFGIIQNNLIQDNYFPAMTESGSTCAYGGATIKNQGYDGQDQDIRFINNVFGRSPTSQNGQTCGYYFTVTDFNPNRPGNVWSGNKYTDGSVANFS